MFSSSVSRTAGGPLDKFFGQSKGEIAVETASAEACAPARADEALAAKVKEKYPALCERPEGTSLPFLDGSAKAVLCHAWRPHDRDLWKDSAEAEETDLKAIFGSDFIQKREEWFRNADGDDDDMLLRDGNWNGNSSKVLFIEQASGELKASYWRSEVLPLLQPPALDTVVQAFNRSKLYTQYGGCEGSSMRKSSNGGYVLTTGPACEISNGGVRAVRFEIGGSVPRVEDFFPAGHGIESCPIM